MALSIPAFVNAHKPLSGSLLALALLAFVPAPAHAALNIPITVNLSEAVTVTGTPQIAVDVGGTTRYATYSSGTGTNALTFTLAPQAGDVDLDGVTVSSPIQLNGGTIKDTKGNNATLTFTPPNTANVKVNYPSLGMDFVYDADGRYTLNGTPYNDLPSFLSAAGGSFTRASIGTYFDSSGNLQTATTNTPRFDYDPVTHAAKGILIEESRTNLGFYSTSPASWINNSATITSTGITELGIFSSARIASTGATWHRVNVPRATGTPWVAVSSPATVTFYYKAGTSGKAGLTIYDTIAGTTSAIAGNVGSLSIVGQTAGVFSNLTQSQIGGIYVISVTFTPNSTTDATGFGFGPYSSVSGQDVIVLGAQIEYGTFPTSFIPTTTAAVTRAADVLTIPTGGWYNSSAGTVYTNTTWQSSSGSNFPLLWTFRNIGATNQWNFFYRMSNSTLGVDAYLASVAQGSYSSSIQPLTGSRKIAASQALNNANVVFGGTLMTPDTSWTPPTFDTLSFNPTKATEWLSTFKYYPARVPDTQLQLLTQ